MAANYWDSTQARYWTFTKKELAEMREALARANAPLHQKFAMPDRRLMSIYIQQSLVKLARRMSLRQQALATAQVYIKRFFLRTEIRKINLYLIMVTAVYLACKMEETPQHIRLMLGEAARQWPELGITESSKIGECEFALISTLSSRLIIHHPYRFLGELGKRVGLTAEEQNVAHCIVNDSYNTDLCLLYPPHIITITAVFFALVVRPPSKQSQAQAHSSLPPVAATPRPHAHQPTVTSVAAQRALLGLKQSGPKLGKLVDWMARSKVQMNEIVDATQEMISLYQVWERYNERVCKEAVSKCLSLSNK